MRIVNRTRGTLVGSRVRVADSWWGRLRGYVGRPEPGQGEGLLLTPCSAIHTYGMRFPVDAIFLDDRGCVLHVLPNLPPGVRSPRVRGARYCLELPAGTVGSTGTRVGDALSWAAGNGARRNAAGIEA